MLLKENYCGAVLAADWSTQSPRSIKISQSEQSLDGPRPMRVGQPGVRQAECSHRLLVVINLSSVQGGSPGEGPGLLHHPLLSGQTLPPLTLEAPQLGSQSQHLS